MLTPDQALAGILERIGDPLGIEPAPIQEAAGRCLAAAVGSDVDLPPFEKSMMDGYAVRSSDFAGGAFVDAGSDGGTELPCVGESRAGEPFAGTVAPYSCVAIYTGAKLPAGCDAVVMVEETAKEGSRVTFARAPRAGQNVSHTAEILRTDQTVFEARRRLTPVDVAVLAAVGCDPVPVFRRPKVSILTTGDELVEVRRRPGEGQIREGNTLYLRGACARLGCEVVRSGIVKDDAAALELAFRQALADSDVLITTGGVSMGKYDLVGQALQGAGVEPVLHKVAIKPGKPIWFGMAGPKPVFGLPGNPVSSLLGTEVFVRPALARLAGAHPDEEAPRIRRGRWTGRAVRGGDRQLNLPVTAVDGADGVVELAPLAYKGSADIVALTRAAGLAIVPAGGAIAEGEIVDWRPLST